MTSSRQSYALIEGDDGQPAREGNAEAAFAIFGFTGRSSEERFEQITCVALPGARGVVLFLQNGPLPSIVRRDDRRRGVAERPLVLGVNDRIPASRPPHRCQG
jgi:hypothetical protein